LFLFGLDKRIDGKASSVDDFFSKVSEKLAKDNARILQQQEDQNQICLNFLEFVR
jgi:hypothetical protein